MMRILIGGVTIMNSYNKECNYKSWLCVVVITIIIIVVVVFVAVVVIYCSFTSAAVVGSWLNV